VHGVLGICVKASQTTVSGTPAVDAVPRRLRPVTVEHSSSTCHKYLGVDTVEVTSRIGPFDFAPFFSSIGAGAAAKGTAWQPGTSVCPVGNCMAVHGVLGICVKPTET